MSKKEEKKEETAEGALGPQLGTDTEDLKKGRVDIRRLSKINALDKAWISFFLLVDDEEGGEYFREFCANYLNLAPSEEGWRVNKMIQMVAGAKGTPSVGDLQKKPGWVSRNLTDRQWKKKADEEGRTIVE